MQTSPSAELRCLAVEPAIAPPTPTRALGLSGLDKSAITGFITGDAAALQALLEDTRQLAEALVGPDGDGARARLLARTAAACRSQLRILEELLAQRLAARDLEAVLVINKTLDGVAKRMALMVKHLAVESALRRRPTVTLTRSESVSFSAEAQ